MNRLTGKMSSMEEVLDFIRETPDISRNITHWHTIPAREAEYADFPATLHPSLREVLQQRGIAQLYSHQAQTFEAAEQGRHTVTVTPTASGKTLCYNLPVLQTILHDDSARALYLFPTKALSQDQVSELQETIELLGADIKTHTYDGDTPPNVRQVIRSAGHIVVTNPDMLHAAILPHHTKWVKLFENLKLIVIDEVHAYRGVFGSHVANVIRRLKRICRFYGSNPQFLCASATIANPREHAERLVGEKVELIDRSGAPSVRSTLYSTIPRSSTSSLAFGAAVCWNPRSSLSIILNQGIQTIVFTRSRARVEILLTYLRDQVKQKLGEQSIRGYRGGYLPQQRREIEKGLRNGSIRGVVSTNALELGIDIGQLQACVINGYPGSIASTWQQSGRAGRRQDVSLTIMVASSNPLDQYVVMHPEYFFERSPEQARIHPDNLIILLDHVKCAAYELPFSKGNSSGKSRSKMCLNFSRRRKCCTRSGTDGIGWSNRFRRAMFPCVQRRKKISLLSI